MRLVVTVRRNDAVLAETHFLERGLPFAQDLLFRGARARFDLHGTRRELASLRRSVTSAIPGARARITESPAPPRRTWLDDLRPVRIAPGIVLTPVAPEASPSQPSERVVVLETVPVFGFGDHPTTKLAARSLARVVRSDARVLDFGTGSGVLGLVALRLGARSVVGVDIDESALAAARANAARNGLSRRFRAVRTLSRPSGRFDVVVANVDRATLLARAKALRARMAGRGALILTGFLASDSDEILGRYRALGLRKTSEAVLRGWAVLVLETRPP